MLDSDAEALRTWLSGARVLIIDDEPANLTYLRHVLETEGYGELMTVPDPVDAVDRFRALDPDVIVVDLWMPRMDGFDVIARFQEMLPQGSYLPILVVTGDPTPEARRRALSLGARDFLTKPVSPSEMRLRVRNLLETRFLHEQLKQHNVRLEERVDERTTELEEARLEILYRLARAAELRDDLTGQHTLRVGRLAGRLAQVLGLDEETVQLIERAAPLHDIGKIGIPDAVLLKTDRLDGRERELMETHTGIGADILAGSTYPVLQVAEQIALSHHERWDGGGYPRGLAGEAIPIGGRIVAVADVFDALTHERPYKPAWTARQALAEIEANAGGQFDPAVVEALLRVAPEAQVLAAVPDGRAVAPAAQAAARGPAVTPADAEEMVPAAFLRRLQEERDVLAAEVEQLRLQLARRPAVRTPRRTAPRRSIPAA